MAVSLCGIDKHRTENGDKNIADESEQQHHIHLMPCTIKHNGSAPVSKFFPPYIEKIDGSVQTVPSNGSTFLEAGVDVAASFRGHPLQGREMKLASGYRGYVFRESSHSQMGDARHAHCVQNFSSFTYWNWDKAPSANDAVMKLDDWIAVAECIHEPF